MLNGRSTFVLTLENNIYLEEISGVIKEMCLRNYRARKSIKSGCARAINRPNSLRHKL